jgi:cytoskeletal protein CcmA (bactofilin family)
MTTKVKASTLADTAVAPGTYGGSTQHSVVTVDQQGRITYAANATPSIANTQITGLIANTQIQTMDAAKLTGSIVASQITSVANNQITGVMTPQQLANNVTYGFSISGSAATATSATSATTAATATSATNATTAAGLASGSWTLTASGTKITFAYNAVNMFSVDSSGNIIAKGDITGFGTP